MKEAKTKEEEEQVRNALHKAGIGEKVDKLAQGIHSHLTHEFDDKGVILSGGEAQKIAIARVFAKEDAEILILDEPSSALDPYSEFNMYQNMMEAAQDKTVIFISHRLSSARMADRIYLLENGGIVEQGAHDELMKLGGKYAYMFHLQAQNYVDDDIYGEIID